MRLMKPLGNPHKDLLSQELQSPLYQSELGLRMWLGCVAGVSGALNLIYSTEQSSFGVRAWNPSSWEVETGDQHLKVILGFTAEPIKLTGLDFLVIFWRIESPLLLKVIPQKSIVHQVELE